jgi:hypothetical protein
MGSSVVSVLDAASVVLEDMAADKGWGKTFERDFQRAIEAVSGARSASIRLARWPAVGSVDIVLPGRVGLELRHPSRRPGCSPRT